MEGREQAKSRGWIRGSHTCFPQMPRSSASCTFKDTGITVLNPRIERLAGEMGREWQLLLETSEEG